MEFPALEKQFHEMKEKDPRRAAEYAYVLMMLYKRAGEKGQAIRFAREAIDLLDKCPMKTLGDCAHCHTEIAGVPIPDLFHQAVVRQRLEPFMLKS